MSCTISANYSGYGIVLDASGFANPVTNLATIDFSAGYQGILAELPWAIGNRGLIEAAAPWADNVGVLIAAAGSVVNFPGATIEAGSGVVIEGAQAAMRNGGVIAGGRFDGVHLTHGGVVFNATGGRLTGVLHAAVVDGAAGTIVNGGVMRAAGAGGAVLRVGGRIVNAGTLSAASYAATIAGGAGTVVNEGMLAAGTGAAVYLADGGTVTNFGTLASGGQGVRIANGGQVDNQGRLLAGTGAGVLLTAGGGVLNAGTIASRLGAGVSIVGGGTVANAGLISGASAGVVFSGGAGTVIDDGTISASGAPIVFASGYANVLTMSGYATFSGTVDGANAIGAPVASTLVLADLSNYAFAQAAPVYRLGFYGTYGSGLTTVIGPLGPATLSGLGTGFTNFETIVNEAAWNFNNSDAIPAGVTLVNAGAIDGSGVTLGKGSVLLNRQGAGIMAGGSAEIRYGNGGYVVGEVLPPSEAVYAGSSSGEVTIVNDLAIYDRHTLGTGIVLLAGGTIANGALIAGGAAGVSLAGSGLVVNDGVATHVSGGVTYETVGSISGTIGISASGLTTIDNSGTISGSRAAVLLGAGYADRIVVRPGAEFAGLVDGGNAVGAGVVSTLELAPGAGTLAGLGTQFTDFGAVAVDAGATWTLGAASLASGATLDVAGTVVLGSGLSGGGVVAVEPGGEVAFAPGQAPSGVTIGLGGTVEVMGAAETIAGYGPGGLTLGGAAALTLDVTGSGRFSVRQANGNSYVTACFASGSRILADVGPCRVEALRVGMRVVTAGGRLAPVRWVGRRRVALARHPRPWDVMPVRVRASAFGDGVPSRDFVLSPDHAVLAGGVLIPVRYLLNGDTIAQETRDEVTYWHVELDRHDLVLAEGLACESYLDTGNRDAFEGGAATVLHPVFASAQGCLALVLDAADGRMVAARAALLARAGMVEREADIRLVVGGVTLRPRDEGGDLVFDLPAGYERGTLVSRVHVPAHVRADSSDTRELGVAVAGMWLDGRRVSLRALNDGWLAPERGFRWSDGAGMVPLSGARCLVLRLGPPGLYRVTARAAARSRRCRSRAAAAG